MALITLDIRGTLEKNIPSSEVEMWDIVGEWYLPKLIKSEMEKQIEQGIEKDKIIKSFSSIGKINSIGVGLFSAEIGASKLFGASKESSYMVITFQMNTSLEVLFIDDGQLSSFSKFRFNGKNNKLESKFFFGDQNYYSCIENSLYGLFVDSPLESKFNCKQFIYQSSGKSKIVDSILNNNNENIIIMNIFDMVRNNDISNTIISGMPYVECSQIFRGSDVSN